jgi:hypothetical protein
MAPEQLVGGVSDARSDQFAFCVAFYEALYCERPFDGATLAELKLAVTQGRVRPPPPGSPVPPWLRQILLRGLRTRPEERFASMEELLSALPADPDSVAAVSDLWRTIIAGIFGVYIVGVLIFRSRHTQPTGEPAAITGRQMLIAVALITVVLGTLVVFARKRLFANRVSRQLSAVLALGLYASMLSSYAAVRFRVPELAANTLEIIGMSAAIFSLGITLRPEFYWPGAIGLVIGIVSVISPAAGAHLHTLGTTPMILSLILAWSWRKKRVS